MPRIVDDDLFQRTVKALCDTSTSARALCDLLLTPKSEGGNASPQVSPRYTAATAHTAAALGDPDSNDGAGTGDCFTGSQAGSNRNDGDSAEAADV